MRKLLIAFLTVSVFSTAVTWVDAWAQDADETPAAPESPAENSSQDSADQKAGDGTDDEDAKWDVSNPPGEWTDIDIDTTRITWSNLDVSPDGKTIVFDTLGDIYTIPMDGGEATALTSGVAWNMQPRFSPDGSEIAFISDRNGADNIWIMNADGSEPREVTKERNHLMHNPSWSPDGQWIAARKGFVSTRSIPAGAIWMYHASGGDGLEVVERSHGEQSQKNIAEPAFSTDGRYLYYSQDTTGGRVWAYNKDSTGQIFEIKRLDRQEGKTDVVASGPGGAIRPTPSPDGKQLAFVTRLPDFTSAIVVMDLDSGNRRLAYRGLDRDLQETNGAHGNTPAIAWTPDSESIVFWAGGEIRRLTVANGEADAIPLRVKTQRRVRNAARVPIDVAPDKVDVRMIRWAQYSPDGEQVVFQALGHLYIKNLADGEQKRLTRQTDHYEFWPSFSPDGRDIVYTTWDDQDLGSVRVVSARGGKGKVISNQPGHYIEPSFSPDGKNVLYRKFAGGYLLSPLWSTEPGIYRVGVSGGEPKRLVNSGFNARYSADGQRVVFSDNVDETKLALKSVNLDGLDERTHYKGAKVTEYRVSPDGRWLAFTEHYTAYVTPFVAIGKTVDIAEGASSVPVKQVSNRSGEWLHWSGDSNTLRWSNASTIYSRELKDAFSFLDGAPEELPEPVEEGVDLAFQVDADAPEGVIALVGGRVVTMRDADRFEEVIQDGVVVVDGNRIVAAGPRDSVVIPDGAFELDVSGKTLIPGLVDVHAHGGMGSQEITPQQNWMQYSNIAFGVTTIHDPSNDTTEVFAHAEMQRAGMTLGPRTFSTGTILYGAIVPGYTAVIDDLDQARFHLQRLKDSGAISVKSYNQLRRDSRQQVLAAADELGMLVVPEGGAKFQHNLTHIVDGHTGVEHALTLVELYDDVDQLWSQTEVGYSPTFVVAYGGLSGETWWYDRSNVWENPRLMRYTPKAMVVPQSMRRLRAPDHHYNHVHVARTAKRLRDQGVGVLIGAHGQREGLGAHWELWIMHQGGFTPWEALRGGTIDGARYLGMDAHVGSIEAGKLADLVVIEGNPLDDLSQSELVSHTMINGRLYRVDTMEQIGNESSTREPFFFEREGGDVFPEAAARALRLKAATHNWTH